MEFGFAYVGLLIYVATLAGMISYHIGYRRGTKINITIDAKVIAATLNQQGLTVMPKGVEWPRAAKERR